MAACFICGLWAHIAVPPVTDKLAEGGHGAVYRAKVGDQVVAVKVFTSAGSDAARRELTAVR